METTAPPRILSPPCRAVSLEVIGADLSRPLPDADFARIRQAWFDHSFLVFRDIDMDPAQQVASRAA